MTIVLDANAIIMHGRAFPNRVRSTVDAGETIVLPQSVKRELVDDVLEAENAPVNHRSSAKSIQNLVDEGWLVIRTPDFKRYGSTIDETRRRIAGDSLPEHAVKADQYIPAIVCELARRGAVRLVTGDQKLRHIVRDIAKRNDVDENIALCEPLTVLR